MNLARLTLLKSIESDFGFALSRIGPDNELVTVGVVEVVVVVVVVVTAADVVVVVVLELVADDFGCCADDGRTADDDGRTDADEGFNTAFDDG